MTNHELDLEPIQKRLDKATPGPWVASAGNVTVCVHQDESVGGQVIFFEDRGVAGEQCSPLDADFIAHARSDIPNLLDEVKRLRLHVAFLEITLGHKEL